MLYFVVPPSNGSSFTTDIENDIIVIGLASLASWLISVSVVKHTTKSIFSSIKVSDLLSMVKTLFHNIVTDTEFKELVSTLFKTMIRSVLENDEIKARVRIFIISTLNDEELRNDMKNFIISILNDDKLREEAKKSLLDVVSEYPVLEKLLGVKNAKKKD